MLSLKNICAVGTAACFLLAFRVCAGTELYGFDHVNPLTEDEKILDMDYPPEHITNYRAVMRENLQMLIDYARKQKSNFQVLTHEGQELLYKSRWEHDLEGYNRARTQGLNAYDLAFLFPRHLGNKEPTAGTPEYAYLNSVNAVVINNYYCGRGTENDVTLNHRLGKFSIEQCASEEDLDTAIARSLLDKKAIYAFTNRTAAFKDLNSQPIINDSARNIEHLLQARNIAFLLDDTLFNSTEDLIAAVSNSNIDVVIINPLFRGNIPFTPDDIRRMQFKKNGARRQLLALVNVSEISPHDYFWNPRWRKGNPFWVVRESFTSPSAYITRYWAPEWRQILSRHFKDVVAAGYDGVFFTGIQNYRYFEHLTPLE